MFESLWSSCAQRLQLPPARRPLLVGSAQTLPLQQRATKNACCCVRAGLTHAVFHHHEAALITFKALALEISRRVDTPARPAYIQGDAALVDVCSKEMQQKTLSTTILST